MVSESAAETTIRMLAIVLAPCVVFPGFDGVNWRPLTGLVGISQRAAEAAPTRSARPVPQPQRWFLAAGLLQQHLVHAGQPGLEAEGAGCHVEAPDAGPALGCKPHCFVPLFLEVLHPGA